MKFEKPKWKTANKLCLIIGISNLKILLKKLKFIDSEISQQFFGILFRFCTNSLVAKGAFKRTCAIKIAFKPQIDSIDMRS